MNTLLSFLMFLALCWFLFAHSAHEKHPGFRGELGFPRVEMGR